MRGVCSAIVFDVCDYLSRRGYYEQIRKGDSTVRERIQACEDAMMWNGIADE